MSARIYSECAKILEKMCSSKSSLSLSNEVMKCSVSEKKMMTAILCKVLEHREILEIVIEQSGILQAEKKLKKWMSMILIAEILLGDGIRCGGKLKSTVMKHKTRLRGEFKKIKVKRQLAGNNDLRSKDIVDICRLSDMVPRYVRINTLKISVGNAIKSLRELYDMMDPCKPSHLKKNTFFRDAHIENILVFGKGTDFHVDKLYLDGSIILQDKASCFPAIALNPPPGSTVIDGCAAPGNKTSHLSEILKNTGTIYAFDMDATRLNTLKRLTSKAGCQNIIPRCCNFLEINPIEYYNVEAILLDPSCSGSGIVSRLDHLTSSLRENSIDENRLDHLAAFQESVISHAMKFPHVKRIVYSTCSVNAEENEEVVVRVLRSHPMFMLEEVLPFWPTRGTPTLGDVDGKTVENWGPLAQKMVRCHPEHGTNGFFVACFVRSSKDFQETDLVT